MATENVGFILSLAASADLSTKQYLAIDVDSSGEAAVAGAAGAIAGILLNKPDAAGKAASVQTDRICKFYAGTAGVSAGDALEVEAGGKLITLAAGESVGVCLMDTAADGIGSVLLK